MWENAEVPKLVGGGGGDPGKGTAITSNPYVPPHVQDSYGQAVKRQCKNRRKY